MLKPADLDFFFATLYSVIDPQVLFPATLQMLTFSTLPSDLSFFRCLCVAWAGEIVSEAQNKWPRL